MPDNTPDDDLFEDTMLTLQLFRREREKLLPTQRQIEEAACRYLIAGIYQPLSFFPRADPPRPPLREHLIGEGFEPSDVDAYLAGLERERLEYEASWRCKRDQAKRKLRDYRGRIIEAWKVIRGTHECSEGC